MSAASAVWKKMIEVSEMESILVTLESLNYKYKQGEADYDSCLDEHFQDDLPLSDWSDGFSFLAFYEQVTWSAFNDPGFSEQTEIYATFSEDGRICELCYYSHLGKKIVLI